MKSMQDVKMVVIAMAGALLSSVVAFAETRYWNADSGLLSDETCWLNGTPQSGDAIAVTNGGTMIVKNDFSPAKALVTCGTIIVGGGTFAPTSLELGDNLAKGAAIFVCSNAVLQVNAVSRGIGDVRVVLSGGELKSASSAKVEALLEGIQLAITPGCVGNVNTAGADAEMGCRFVDSSLDSSKLLHRWSLDQGSMVDSVGGLTAECHGTGIVATEKGVSLPGGSGDPNFVSLGSVFPANLTAFTLEFWAKQVGVQKWSPIFNAFNADGMKLSMSWTRGLFPETDMIWVYASSSSGANLMDKLQPWTLGTLFHVSITACRDASLWTLVFRKKDASTGVTLATCALTAPAGWDPAQLTSLDLGHRVSGDACDAQADYEEVRVWSQALSDADLTLSVLNGPDTGLSAGRLVKTGSGNLYLPGKVESVSAVDVSEGGMALDEAVRPTHRWSLANGDLSDSYGSVAAALKGSDKAGITTDATGVTLPGGSRLSAYVELGMGSAVLGTEDREFTFEFWATRLDSAESKLYWPRIFSFFETSGSTPTVLSMGWSFSTDVTRDLVATCYNGSTYAKNYFADKLAPWLQNVEYHIAVAVAPTTVGWKATFYKQDAATGVTLKEFTTDMPAGWSPSALAGCVMVLGCSPDIGQSDAHAHYSEVRVWDRALTRAELEQSARIGKTSLPIPTCRTSSSSSVSSKNLTHRWSFNGDWSDSVGGRDAVATGLDCDNIVFTDGAYATLPGSATTRHAYIELSKSGDNLFAEDTDGVTLEIWTRLNATEGLNWQRLLTIYDAANGNVLFDTFVKVTDPASDVLGSRVNGGTICQVAGKLAPWVVGQWFHVAIVVRNDGSANPVTIYKQDPVTGWTLASYELPGQAWTPTMLNGTVVGLGYSHENYQYDARASYSEVRVWNRPLTEKELTMCAQAGPDAIPDFNAGVLPETADVTIRNDSILALCGRTQTVHAVVANGTVKGGGALTVTSGLAIGGVGSAGTLTLEDGVRLSSSTLFDVIDGIIADRLIFVHGSAYDLSSIGLNFTKPHPLRWNCFGSAAGAILSGSFDFGAESSARWKMDTDGDLLVQLRKAGMIFLIQ